MTEIQQVSFPLGLTQIFMSPWVTPLLVLVVSVAGVRLVFSSKSLKYNLPPMPKGLPVFGSMLTTRGPKTHQTLIELAKEYGSLYALKTGVRTLIVIMKADLAYEALIQDGQVFGSRILLQSRLHVTGWRSVNSAPSGAYWRGIRKNLVSHVLSTSKVTSFKPFREMELSNLIERVKEQAKNNDNVVPVLSNCRFTVFSILIHVCFGKKFDASTVKELDMVLRRLLVLLAPQVIDFLPFVEYFNKSHKNECSMLLARLRKIFVPQFEEHRKHRKNGTPAGDYVDSLLDLQKEMKFSETDMLGLTAEVITGGTDTTANTVEWTMANLIHHPEIQARLYEEIKSVVPFGKAVSEEDTQKMPYLNAIVKESLRKHPPLPFLLPRGVTKQTKFRGYDIPQDSMILFHVQAMQNDPERWDHPEIFNPDRFLSEVPNPDYDMTGSHGPRSVDFIPFGAGRRICPAMNLGLKHVHLIIARLIQTFEWSTVNPGEAVDFDDKLAFTVVMKNPLYSRIKERSTQ